MNNDINYTNKDEFVEKLRELILKHNLNPEEFLELICWFLSDMTVNVALDPTFCAGKIMHHLGCWLMHAHAHKLNDVANEDSEKP